MEDFEILINNQVNFCHCLHQRGIRTKEISRNLSFSPMRTQILAHTGLSLTCHKHAVILHGKDFFVWHNDLIICSPGVDFGVLPLYDSHLWTVGVV